MRNICLLWSNEISDEILQREPSHEYPLRHSEEEELVLVVLGPDLSDGGEELRNSHLFTWNSGMVERISMQMEARRNSEETITRICRRKVT